MKAVEPIKFDRNGVDKILNEAREREFEQVIILGLKDNYVTVMPSGTTDKIKLIGALEIAKQHMWSGT